MADLSKCFEDAYVEPSRIRRSDGEAIGDVIFRRKLLNLVANCGPSRRSIREGRLVSVF